MEAAWTWTRRVVLMVVAVGALLATCAGCINAVEWIMDTFGATASGMAGTFLAGWILATATAELRSFCCFRGSFG
jgi:hypothetical protein